MVYVTAQVIYLFLNNLVIYSRSLLVATSGTVQCPTELYRHARMPLIMYILLLSPLRILGCHLSKPELFLSSPQAFESHICFPTASPPSCVVQLEEVEWGNVGSGWTQVNHLLTHYPVGKTIYTPAEPHTEAPSSGQALSLLYSSQLNVFQTSPFFSTFFFFNIKCVV